jgi:hypothetical protein
MHIMCSLQQPAELVDVLELWTNQLWQVSVMLVYLFSAVICLA